jgi:hypothetical protein
MQIKEIRIAVVCDSRNKAIAETYLEMLKSGPFASCAPERILFDAERTDSAVRELERHQVVLAHVGIPGQRDYEGTLHAFMDAFVGAKRKPAAGIVTHDSEHTRYIIDRWLGIDSRHMRELPDHALSIIDARRPLRMKGLETAMEVLLGKLRRMNPPRATSSVPVHVHTGKILSRRNHA